YVNRFVRSRDLIQEGVTVPPLYTFHCGIKLRARELLAGAGPAVLAARAVRRGVQREAVALADHDVRTGAHRAGNQPGRALTRVDRALPGQPYVLSEMLFLGRVIVVTVHRLGELDVTADPGREAVDDAVHHLLAVQQREMLRPAQIPDVVPELNGPLDQVGEVGVGQLDPPLPA